MTLQGVTVAQMNTTGARAAFVAAVANFTGVTTSAVAITSVSAVTISGRHLLDTTGVAIAFTVAAPSATAAASVATTLNAATGGSSIFVGVLNSNLVAQGVSGVTVTGTTASGVTTTGVPAPSVSSAAFKAAAPLASALMAMVAAFALL